MNGCELERIHSRRAVQCAIRSRANLEALARENCALVHVLALLLRRVAPTHLTTHTRNALFSLATSTEVSAEPNLSSAIWYAPPPTHDSPVMLEFERIVEFSSAHIRAREYDIAVVHTACCLASYIS